MLRIAASSSCPETRALIQPDPKSRLRLALLLRLRLDDVAEYVRLAIDAHQMRILLSAVIVDRVCAHVVAVLGQDRQRLLTVHAGAQGRPHLVFRPLTIVDRDHLHARPEPGPVRWRARDHVADFPFFADDGADRKAEIEAPTGFFRGLHGDVLLTGIRELPSAVLDAAERSVG